MKYLFLLLLCLPAYGQEKKPIRSLVISNNTPPHYLPYVMQAEINRYRTPVANMEIHNRLVRVQDNFRWRMDVYDKSPSIFETNGSARFMENYMEIYLDPQTMNYYQALFYIPSIGEFSMVTQPPLPKKSFKDRNRFVYLTNLAPHIRVYADTANTNFIYGQYIIKIPDLYKGYLFMGGYLYADPENKIKVVFTPLTNVKTKEVAYKATHPITKQIFYAARYWKYYPPLEKELLYSFIPPHGGITWIRDTPEELFQYIEEQYLKENYDPLDGW